MKNQSFGQYVMLAEISYADFPAVVAKHWVSKTAIYVFYDVFFDPTYSPMNVMISARSSRPTAKIAADCKPCKFGYEFAQAGSIAEIKRGFYAPNAFRSSRHKVPTLQMSDKSGIALRNKSCRFIRRRHLFCRTDEKIFP